MKEYGKATEGQIGLWKNKYGRVKQVVITDGEEKYYVYLRRPDMKTMRVCSDLDKQGKQFESAEVLVKNCLLNKGEEVEKLMNDSVLFTQMANTMQGFFGETQAVVKNL